MKIEFSSLPGCLNEQARVDICILCWWKFLCFFGLYIPSTEQRLEVIHSPSSFSFGACQLIAGVGWNVSQVLCMLQWGRTELCRTQSSPDEDSLWVCFGCALWEQGRCSRCVKEVAQHMNSPKIVSRGVCAENGLIPPLWHEVVYPQRWKEAMVSQKMCQGVGVGSGMAAGSMWSVAHDSGVACSVSCVPSHVPAHFPRFCSWIQATNSKRSCLLYPHVLQSVKFVSESLAKLTLTTATHSAVPYYCLFRLYFCKLLNTVPLMVTGTPSFVSTPTKWGFPLPLLCFHVVGSGTFCLTLYFTIHSL